MKNLMRGLSSLGLLCLLACSPATETASEAQSARASDVVHLFFFFRDNGQDGVYLAVSEDGYRFSELNGGQPIFKAPEDMGNGLTRDPSVVLGPDERFHMVWTTGWWRTQNFGIAHSDDLLNWDGVQAVAVNEKEPSALNVWAPEIFYDDVNERYQIVYASTVRRLHPDGTSEDGPEGFGLEHRQYAVTSADLEDWSATELFFDQGFNVIDAMIARRAEGDYVMAIKNETLKPEAAKSIHLSFASTPAGPWSEAGPAITPEGVWAEGASLNRVGEEWLLYFDAYRDEGYGAMRSTDVQNWEDVSAEMELPEGIRHGTVLSVARERVAHLLDASPNNTASVGETPEKPNFVVIFVDDLGYGDIGSFGATQIETPRIDALAQEGMRLTSFYAQTVCGPSRAALMTGSYPLRVAQHENREDIHPVMHSDEITIAEVLRDNGYVSAAIGKWGLAFHSHENFIRELLPTYQGFDYFFGSQASNDLLVDLIEGDEIVEHEADMAMLTERYTDKALEFIRANRDRPFFVYLAPNMPHTLLAASERFRGRSERGLYGDVVEELDFNTGRIVDLLKELELEQNTYVIFTSDNGPWLWREDHGGSAGPLRGGKTMVWEGGFRVPFVVWAPGRVPPGQASHRLTSAMDLLPTLASLSGARAPEDRVIDGQDISQVFHGDIVKSDDPEVFYFYAGWRLAAVREGKWKLHLPRPAGDAEGSPQWTRYAHPSGSAPVAITTPALFDLENDVGETTDVAADHPEIVKRLTGLIERAREDIGDYDRIGENARFFDEEYPRRPGVQLYQ